MAENGNNASGENREFLYLVGGAALVVLGVGLIATHSGVRKALSAGLAGVMPNLQGRLLPDLGTLGSDVERYLKLKSM